MNIYLHKILPVLALPTGLILLLLLAGLLLRRRGLIWTALVLFWVCSTPLASDFLARALENGAERIEATSMPTADAIVVLSEGRVVAPGAAAISEWTDGDRFWGGIALYQAGKAPMLVFTGGWSPWEPNAKPEGEVLISYAKALGVPSKAMRTTGLVVNTDEEAQAVTTLLVDSQLNLDVHGAYPHPHPSPPLEGEGTRLLPLQGEGGDWGGVKQRIHQNRLDYLLGQRAAGSDGLSKRPNVLLVTSAYHMPRAQRLFERAGLTVIAYPVDFQGEATRNLSVMDFVPSARAFKATEMASRETIGRVYYAFRSSGI